MGGQLEGRSWWPPSHSRLSVLRRSIFTHCSRPAVARRSSRHREVAAAGINTRASGPAPAGRPPTPARPRPLPKPRPAPPLPPACPHADLRLPAHNGAGPDPAPLPGPRPGPAPPSRLSPRGPETSCPQGRGTPLSALARRGSELPGDTHPAAREHWAVAKPPPKFCATPGMVSRGVKLLLDTWVTGPRPWAVSTAGLIPTLDQELTKVQGAATANGPPPGFSLARTIGLKMWRDS